jgi:hypothetical protein
MFRRPGPEGHLSISRPSFVRRSVRIDIEPVRCLKGNPGAMSTRAQEQWRKQVEGLERDHQKALQVRAFLLSEREIVLGLLEKSLSGSDRERRDNLRTRIHEKNRQLQLVETELKDIASRLREAKDRLQQAETSDRSGAG